MPEKITQEQAVAILTERFPELDFSQFTYVNSTSEGKVICPTHGEFTKSFKLLTKLKHGCSACAGTGANCADDKDSFFEKVKAKFGQNFVTEYSASIKEEYAPGVLVHMVCPIHGPFSRKAGVLIHKKSSSPCSSCNTERRAKGKILTLDEFNKRAEIDNSSGPKQTLLEYSKSKLKATFICEKHGEYFKRPNDFMNGQRCPKCSRGGSSSPENSLLEFLKSIYEGPIIHRFRSRGRKELDIFFPLLDIGIELDGLYFHSEDHDYENRFNLLDKTLHFRDLGIRVIHVFEDEWILQPEIVKNRLKSILALNKGIYARKTKVVTLTNEECKSFLEKTHLQGANNYKYRYGLVHEETLVACMAFSSPRDKVNAVEGRVELMRYSSIGTIVGGASKLLSHFIKKEEPISIISYSDNRWGEGDVYSKLGFKKDGVTSPGYFWCKPQQRFPRHNFQKYKLVEKYPEYEGLTENEICRRLGFFKVYDCGHSKWLLEVGAT